jgi:5'-nucleotidase
LRILLTNDDGLMAEGLGAAYKGLTRAGHTVVACAPDGERSGSSHSVTLWRPMTVRRTKMPSGDLGHAVSGSPADAARVGLTLFNDPKLDLVISGVNNDTNLAYDVNYSGTVGAALEAAVAGLPAVAISVEKELPYKWDEVGELVAKIAALFPSWKVPTGIALNVNIPKDLKHEELVWVKPHRATPYDFLKQTRIDEDTLECVRYREKSEKLEPQETDVWYFTQGYVTVTPLVPVGGHLDSLTRLSGKDPSFFPGM